MVVTSEKSSDSFDTATQAKEETGEERRQADNNSDPERNHQQVMEVRALASVGKANKGTNNPNNSAQVGEEQKPENSLLELAVVMSPRRVKQQNQTQKDS